MLGFSKAKKKNYPSTKAPTTIDDLREGMIKVMNEIYEEEGRMPTRIEIRSRFAANHVVINIIRAEWWATIQPDSPTIQPDSPADKDSFEPADKDSFEDAIVADQDSNVSGGESSFEAINVTPLQESEKIIEEQVEEAYQKGVKDGKGRTKKRVRVRVPNAH